MPIRPQRPPPDQQHSPDLPPGPEVLTFDQFQGVNTSTSRPGVKDSECYWQDGFLTIGPRLCRTLPGIGEVIWTVEDSLEPPGTTITFFDTANIGTTQIIIAFLSNGSLYQVNTDTGTGTQITGAGTIQRPDPNSAGITQWGTQYVIIVCLQTDGYYIWDGVTLFRPGDPAPTTGTMPTGIGGSTVEIFQGRVWVANIATIFFTGPGLVADFTSGSGGGEFTSTDSFLRNGYVRLRQSSGFLYLVADSSTNYISNVQTSGSPPVTTFTNQNADPEVGSPWAGTVLTFGRNIIFANSFGVHVSFGAAVTKISEPLDGVYNSVPNFSGIIPSAAKANVFGKKLWMMILPIIDPISHAQVNKLLIWNQKLWCASEQDADLLYIATQEFQSVLTAWGTDGDGLFRLFQNASTGFSKALQSRLWDTPIGIQETKAAVRLWGMTQYYSTLAPDLQISIDNESDTSNNIIPGGLSIANWVAGGPLPAIWTNSFGQTVTWFASGGATHIFGPTAVAQVGPLLGFTLRTSAADMAVILLSMQPENVAYRG